MEERKLKALVVEDEEVIRDFLTRFLSLNNIEVKVAEGSLKAIEMAKKEEFDIIFLDVRMPDMDGFQVLKELKGVNHKGRYIMMTGYAVDNLLEELKKEGISGFIKKPFEIEEIMSRVNEIRRLRKDLNGG